MVQSPSKCSKMFSSVKFGKEEIKMSLSTDTTVHVKNKTESLNTFLGPISEFSKVARTRVNGIELIALLDTTKK